MKFLDANLPWAKHDGLMDPIVAIGTAYKCRTSGKLWSDSAARLQFCMTFACRFDYRQRVTTLNKSHLMNDRVSCVGVRSIALLYP